MKVPLCVPVATFRETRRGINFELGDEVVAVIHHGPIEHPGPPSLKHLGPDRWAQTVPTESVKLPDAVYLQLGYESRCSAPHAFDVVLGSQLGLGAYRALAEEHLDGHMVSVSGQLELRYIPFADLVDPLTLATHVRFVDRGSDFHRLAHELGTRFGKS